MNKYTTQSDATRMLAAGQTHDEMRPGPGVIIVPTHEQIAKRAYDIFVKSGRKLGQCTQNWRQAEHDLRTDGRPS
jgi:hypothetical protein